MELNNLSMLFKDQEIIRHRYEVANHLITDYMGSISLRVHSSHSSGVEPLTCTICAYNDDSKLIKIIGTEIQKYYKTEFDRINLEIKKEIDKCANIKNTKVVSGFPGTGKSHIFKNNTNLLILDSDSSNFSWITKGVRNPEFPKNYINHIKAYIGKVDIIFVSSHQIVREALQSENIHYTLVYPDKSLKNAYLERYIQRGNDEKFITMITNDWDKFVDDCDNDVFANRIKLIKSDEFMDIILPAMV